MVSSPPFTSFLSFLVDSVDEVIRKNVTDAFKASTDTWGCHCHHLELIIKNSLKSNSSAKLYLQPSLPSIPYIQQH